MTASRRSLRSLSLLTALFALGAAANASANGIAVARFGGAHGNVAESNATSIYYNPGAVGFTEGTQLMLDLALVQRNASYDRPASVISPSSFNDDPAYDNLVRQANTGEATLSNQLYAPMLGVTTDFGSNIGLRGGLAFFVPFGGSSVWDTTDEVGDFQESDWGTTRWFNIEGTIRTQALAMNLAYRLGPVSIGLSGNAYYSQVNTIRARNADATDNPATEGLSWIKGDSWDLGLGVGALWQVNQALNVGLSYQSRPNFTGDMTFDAELRNAFPTSGGGDGEPVYMTQQLPDIFRLGVSYRGEDSPFEFRLFGDLTRWSVFEQQCVILQEGLSPAEARDACAVTDTGAQVDGELTDPVANFLRRWEDAFGVRAGASYYMPGPLELFVGGGFDQNAIPDETLEPAFLDANKFSADLGARLNFGNLAIMMTGTGIFYGERDTTDTNIYQSYEPPSRQPSAGGVYNQSLWMLDTTVEYAF